MGTISLQMSESQHNTTHFAMNMAQAPTVIRLIKAYDQLTSSLNHIVSCSVYVPAALRSAQSQPAQDQHHLLALAFAICRHQYAANEMRLSLSIIM